MVEYHIPALRFTAHRVVPTDNHGQARVLWWDAMESKDGVHAASQQWNSAQRSPHRTSSFHHIRRSNQPCLLPLPGSLMVLQVAFFTECTCLVPLVSV